MEKERKSFEDYVNSNYEERMKKMWEVAKTFLNDEPDPRQNAYELGWISALQWIGRLLGIELAMPTDEDKKKIDELFNNNNKK